MWTIRKSLLLIPAMALTAVATQAGAQSSASLVNLLAGRDYTSAGRPHLGTVEVASISTSGTAVTGTPTITVSHAKLTFSVSLGASSIASIELSRFGCGYTVPATIDLTRIAMPTSSTSDPSTGVPVGSDPTTGLIPANSAGGRREELLVGPDSYRYLLRYVHKTGSETITTGLSEFGYFPASGSDRVRFIYRRVVRSAAGTMACTADARFIVRPAPTPA
jgi:hypothetical protein